MEARVFTRCLRDLRISRGFAKARHFAEAVGIGENRYTRYERGEAEPNIALIYKFCEVLRVHPNELFGFSSATGNPGAGFAEQRTPPFDTAPLAAAVAREVLAWKLARKLVRVRALEAGEPMPSGITEQRAAASVFMELERAPFRAISEVLARAPVARVSTAEEDELARLIDHYIALIGATDGGARGDL